MFQRVGEYLVGLEKDSEGLRNVSEGFIKPGGD